MPEIRFPKKMHNEFGVASALITLVAHCVHPLDGTKHSEMVGVLNIWLREKFANIDLKSHADELDNPLKYDEFWREVKEFGDQHSVTIPETLPAQTTPRKFTEAFIAALYGVATNTLELPENITKFLLDAKTPASIKEEIEAAKPMIGCCMMIVCKLMQMHNTPTDLRGDISLNKAIELLLLKNSGCPLKNPTDIKKAWAKYKKSIHIAIGLALAGWVLIKFDLIKEHNKGKYMHDMVSPATLGLVLIFSKFAQWFLLSIPASRHSGSTRFMKPNQLWLMPEKIAPDTAHFKRWLTYVTPLNNREIAVLKGKRRLPKL